MVENPSAFPSGQEDYWRNEGMTLRDYFAAAALGGMMVYDSPLNSVHKAYDYASTAYNLADAMLIERKRNKS